MDLGQEYGKHGIVLFDGVCNLCTTSVQFIIKRDKKDYFRFASFQSETGEKLRLQAGLPNTLKTFCLIENGKCYTRSTGALRVSKHLKGGWPMLYGFLLVPKFIRDFVYNTISKYRYGWFGKQDSCMVPTPELKEKFI